jgi:flagellar export protein FliJ
MKAFHFPLESLLKLRRSERDQRCQLLAQALQQDSQLVITRRETEAVRMTQIDELRCLEEGGQDVNIDASASRRSYAGRLSGDLTEIDSRRAALAEQIDLCRSEMLRADQAVKSLEKLAEQQRAGFFYQQERKEQMELEQTWQARDAVPAARIPGS